MNHLKKTDEDWENFGASDPYFAVVTHDKYHKENLDHDRKEDFFATGREHIASLMKQLPPDMSRKRAFDFGCGVGRLAIPLGNYFDEVVGADVSPSMLREACVNRDQQQADNVSFVQSTDSLSEVQGSFDLVHTFIVLQHIPVARGNEIFKQLVNLIAPGGFGAIQMTYSKGTYAGRLEKQWPPCGPNGELTPVLSQVGRLMRNKWKGFRRQTKQLVRKCFPFGGKRQAETPHMQMNPYTLNPLFHFLQETGVEQLSVELTDHGGEYGVSLLFQKPAQANAAQRAA